MKAQWVKDEDGQEFIADMKEFRNRIKENNVEVPEILVSENDNEIFIETDNKNKKHISNRHCSRCGLRLAGKPNGHYSTSTREEDMSLYCPSLLCGHAFINHNFTKSGVLHRTCTKCNDKIYNDYAGTMVTVVAAAAVAIFAILLSTYLTTS